MGKKEEQKRKKLTCAESFPCEDAYHYHFANHHSTQRARILVQNPLQRNQWTHWEAEYNSEVHYPVAVVAKTVVTSWNGVALVDVVAAAQTAWKKRKYSVVRIAAAVVRIVAGYTAVHIAADAS
jgi:hypothetical protein